MRIQAVLVLALAATFVPADALAKPRQARGPAVDAVRLTPYAGVAGGGRAIVRDPDFGNDSFNMRGGGHLGARLEIPVMDYFSLGGMAEFGATSVRGANRADLHFDVSFWAKGRYVLDLKPFDLELYVGVPLGVSFALLDDYDGGRYFGPGLNSGLFFGSQLLFKRGGFFVDMGPRFRRSWHDEFDVTWSYGTRQFNMNFGGVLLF